MTFRNEKMFDKFKTKQYIRRIVAKLHMKGFNGDIRELEDQIDQFYHSLIYPVIRKYQPNDLYMFMASNDELNKPVVIPFKQISEFDFSEFGNKIFKLVQSREEFLLKALNVEIYVKEAISGKGYGTKPKRTKAPEMPEEHSLRKQSVVTIKNKGL